MKNERLLAYALIGLGVITLLSRFGNADWLWTALLGVVFLFGYVARQNYGFLIAGSLLLGVAVGTLIGSQGGFLLSLGVGFFMIDRLEPRPNRWPLYTAGIFAVLGGLSALGDLGLLNSAGFALLLVAAGAYLLYREWGKSETGLESRHYGPSAAPSATPPPAATATPTATPAATSTAPPADGATPAAAQPPQTPAAPQTPPPEATEEPADEGGATSSPPPSPAADTAGRDLQGAATTPTATLPTVPASDPAPEPPAQPELAADAQARLRSLELWRKETASSAGTPAYIIFSNDTLFRIASANPQTLTELDRIRGVGPVKLERYGEAVLNVLRAAP